MHATGWQWQPLPASAKSRLRLLAYVKGADKICYTAGMQVSTLYLTCLIEAAESDTWSPSIPHGQADTVYARIREGCDWMTLKEELLLTLQRKANKSQKQVVRWSVDGDMDGEAGQIEAGSGDLAILRHGFELNTFEEDAEASEVEDEQYADLAAMIENLDNASVVSDMAAEDTHAGPALNAAEADTEPLGQALEVAGVAESGAQESVANPEEFAHESAPATSLQAQIGPWGIFRLGMKRATLRSAFGGIEASCPLHARSSKTGCKKYISCKDATLASALEAATVAKWWCVQGLKVERQWEHVFETPLFPCPSAREVEAMRVATMPAGHALVADEDFYGGGGSQEARPKKPPKSKQPAPKRRQKRASGGLRAREASKEVA